MFNAPEIVVIALRFKLVSEAKELAFIPPPAVTSTGIEIVVRFVFPVSVIAPVTLVSAGREIVLKAALVPPVIVSIDPAVDREVNVTVVSEVAFPVICIAPEIDESNGKLMLTRALLLVMLITCIDARTGQLIEVSAVMLAATICVTLVNFGKLMAVRAVSLVNTGPLAPPIVVRSGAVNVVSAASVVRFRLVAKLRTPVRSTEVRAVQTPAVKVLMVGNPEISTTEVKVAPALMFRMVVEA